MSEHLCTSWGWTGRDDDEGRQIMRCDRCGRLRAWGTLKWTDCKTQAEIDAWDDGHYWGGRDHESDMEMENELLRDELDELRARIKELES